VIRKMPSREKIFILPILLDYIPKHTVICTDEYSGTFFS
jgi:hypothetical protein